VSAPVATERPCPECGSTVPVATGYPDWCDCGWNLEPPPVRGTPRGRFARLAERAGRRSGERMARELLEAGSLEPRWTPATLAAFAVAGGVHLLSLALVAGGIAAIAVEFPNVVSILIGLAMAGTGVMMRPRLSRLANDARPLDPARTPALHELVAAVADALDRPPPDLVAVCSRPDRRCLPRSPSTRRGRPGSTPSWRRSSARSRASCSTGIAARCTTADRA
jgi:hypothetical protein